MGYSGMQVAAKPLRTMPRANVEDVNYWHERLLELQRELNNPKKERTTEAIEREMRRVVEIIRSFQRGMRGASHSEDMTLRLPVGGSVAVSLAKTRAKFFNAKLGQQVVRQGLGQSETDPSLTFYNFYHDLIIPIMNAACQSEVNTQACASFNVQLQQIENSLNQALANNDITALIIAGIEMKNLYDDVKDTLKPDEPPPVNPPPPPQPPPSATGVPTWVWIIGGVVVIGAGVATVVAVTRK